MPSMIHLETPIKFQDFVKLVVVEAISSPASDVSLSNLASLLILKALFPVVTMDIQ